jgi:hypothetical protein
MSSPAVAERFLVGGLLVITSLRFAIGPPYVLSRRAERRRVQRARLGSESDRALRPPGGQGQIPELRLPAGFPAKTAERSSPPSLGGDR